MTKISNLRSIASCLLIIIFGIVVFQLSTSRAMAQDPLASPASNSADQTIDQNSLASIPPKTSFALAKVSQILNERTLGNGNDKQISQSVRLKVVKGPEKDAIVTIDNYLSTTPDRKLKENETVVLAKTEVLDQVNYYVSDIYRLPSALVLLLIFFGLTVIFARAKGVSSFLGLIFSILVLLKFVVPQILAGHSPLLISMIGALLIALVSLYLAHGFNRRTSIALLATLITLAIAFGLAISFVAFSRLSGAGSEEAFYLQIAPNTTINLKGLLLGGIIIGVLGVLDDITTAQVAAVAEIRNANPRLDFKELYKRGLVVGREHITSLVNTLVLAYVGASFPLFLLFNLSDAVQPFWVTLNSELIMEELVRTLVGSSALIFAVPIATFLAAYLLLKRPPDESDVELSGHSHHHH